MSRAQQVGNVGFRFSFYLFFFFFFWFKEEVGHSNSNRVWVKSAKIFISSIFHLFLSFFPHLFDNYKTK